MGLAALAALSLGACAAMGPEKDIAVTMPDGERATIIAHEQSVPDFFLSRDGMKINYIVRGEPTDKQRAAVAAVEKACRLYVGVVRPSNLVAVIANGAVYATAGYIGLNLGARAFAGADPVQYGRYGAAASGFAGAANGVVTIGGQTYTYENCGREVFDLFPHYGVHVLQKSPY